ncbi:hypothetical protein Ae706Ps2_4331c [Pseudonocardia sp. Ae706_Ps2]|nr:hypothetical protein Ae706Ps2_4331c [Pseudonocardia sp. Ae706_Ps2]
MSVAMRSSGPVVTPKGAPDQLMLPDLVPAAPPVPGPETDREISP